MEGVWKEAPDEADQTDQDPSVQARPQCPLQGEDLGVMLWELLGKLLINQHFPTLGTAPSAQHQQSCSAGGLPGLFRSCLSLRPGMCFGVLRELGFCWVWWGSRKASEQEVNSVWNRNSPRLSLCNRTAEMSLSSPCLKPKSKQHPSSSPRFNLCQAICYPGSLEQMQ